MAMKLEYVKVANYAKDTGCPHNDALLCNAKKCKACGWNPSVAKMRLDNIKRLRVDG